MSSEQSHGDGAGLDEGHLLVAGPKRLQLTHWQKVAVAGLVALIFLAFIWVDHASHAKGAEKPDLSIQPNTNAFRPAPISLLEPAVPPAPAAPAKSGANEVTPAETPIFAYAGGSSSDSPATVEASAGQSTRQVVPSLRTSAEAGADALASKLKPTALQGARAELLPHPDMFITKGTLIPCTLLTAINTELAGFVKCVLPESVRSTTGNVILLDRGTTIVGEIRQGVAQGQSRVFILWDRAETPEHAIISLDSPGADEMGRAGVDGAVNNHFWDRFGSALMLSVVQGALQAGAAVAGNSAGGNGTYFTNFQSSGQQLADTSLQSSINIPPTLEKSQGDNVSIFVARDIDFSDVYRLSLTK